MSFNFTMFGRRWTSTTIPKVGGGGASAGAAAVGVAGGGAASPATAASRRHRRHLRSRAPRRTCRPTSGTAYPSR